MNLKFNLFNEWFLISHSPESCESYGRSSNALIFSLLNRGGLAPFESPVAKPQTAFNKSFERGPAFGTGNEIHISKFANSNTGSYTLWQFLFNTKRNKRQKK